MDLPASGTPPLRLAWPAILVAAVLLAPFANKAYTIDDPVFLYEARHLQVDPLHPTAFEMWQVGRPQRLSRTMASGPLMAYLLVPVVWAGEREWAAHALVFLLLAAALWATAALALRGGLGERTARVSALLLATTPAVLGMAGTVMPDIAAMCFGVLALERLLAWKQERRLGQALWATAAFALAVLTRSQMALLAGAAVLLLEREDWWRVLAPVLGAVGLAGVALWLTRDPQPFAASVWDAIRVQTGSLHAGRHLVAFLLYLVLALPFGLPWLLGGASGARRRITLAVALSLVAGILVVGSPDPMLQRLGWRRILCAAGAGVAAAALLEFAVEAARRRDRFQGMLVYCLGLGLPVVLYVHLAPKYLVPSAPAVALLVARRFSSLAPRFATWAAAATCVTGAALGLLILRADAEFAGLGRRAAAELIAPRAVGGRVWFVGYWGFQYYAERAGALSVSVVPPLAGSGDYVVSATVAHGSGLLPVVPRRELLATLEDAQPGGRVMAGGAGFFSDGWGFLPWTWSSEVRERFSLWRVR